MASLFGKIKEDLNNAMRNKETNETGTLRMLIAAINNKEIALRSKDSGGLDDEAIIEVIQSEIKKRSDSASAYKEGGRDDLVKQEESEIRILKKYLPEQLSDGEIEKIVRNIVAAHGHTTLSDFGKVMGQVMPKVKGKADGNKISEVVKRVLNEG